MKIKSESAAAEPSRGQRMWPKRFVCRFCKKPFLCNWLTGFCSRACRYGHRQNRVVLLCRRCNEPFERKLSEVLKVPHSEWCSRKCWKIAARAKCKSYPKVGSRHVHRVVAEQMLGRPLQQHEIVHHKDENRKNFSRRNLSITTRREHSRHHSTGKHHSLETRLKMSRSGRLARLRRRT